MPTRTDPLATDFVDSALELHRRRPWQEVPADAVFLVRVPSEALPLAVQVLGEAGEDFGLAIGRGESGFRQIVGMQLDRATSELADAGDLMTVSFLPWASLPRPVRRRLKKIGIVPRQGRVATVPFVKRPYELSLPAGPRDLRTLLWIVRAVLAAHEAGELRPSVLPTLDSRERHVLELDVGGTPHEPTVAARIVPWPENVDAIELPPLVALPSDLAELPRLDERWLVAQLHVNGELRGDSRTMNAIFVADERSGLVRGQGLAMGDELAPIADGVTETFRGRGVVKRRGLPRDMVFGSSRLHAAFAPALAGLDVGAVLDPDYPPLRSLSDELEKTAAALAPAELRVPETLEEWRAADRRVISVLVEEVVEKDRRTKEATERYFGAGVDPEEIFQRMEHDAPFGAFVEWLAADYRATKGARTIVEKRLAKKRVDPAERVLLEARRSALLSIFRVDSREPGATLEVEDVLSGEHFTIQDRALSGCALEGCCLPLRLLRVREWMFAAAAGPVLEPLYVTEALALLERSGARLMPDGLRQGAHLLGRLWPWLAEHERRHPAVLHQDGEAFELQTATFRVTDRAALERVFEEREDVELEESAGEWLWLRQDAPDGDDDLLGFLTFVGDDRLALEVTASSRLERGRRWLEAVPGVRFERTEVHEWETVDRPPDDRPHDPPEPLSREEIDALERAARERCLAWLDERSPALGDLTPRQACATEEGRRRVARLVRTLPSVATPDGPIAVPREELLHELGMTPGS